MSLLRICAASFSNIECDTTSALSIRHPEVRSNAAVGNSALVPIDEGSQGPAPRTPPAAGVALAGADAVVEMRPAGVGIVAADAVFHLPVAARVAVAEAGVGHPDRGGALALWIGRHALDAALEHHRGPMVQRIAFAGQRRRQKSEQKQQNCRNAFHGA